jgi:8-oxo-dGTP pyrophosphatase MutT (NUDIX family)
VTLAALAAAVRAHRAVSFPVDTIPAGHLPAGGLAHAAVLVPVFEQAGEVGVLLTRRPATMRRHAGQISFPGGRVEPGETALEAALREAHEEIGLPPGRAEVLGALSETIVHRTAFRLTPWVASVPYPYPYAAAPGEVEELLAVPLAALSAPGGHRVEQIEVWGMRVQDHRFLFGADEIWGATGRVLAELVELGRAA